MKNSEIDLVSFCLRIFSFRTLCEIHDLIINVHRVILSSKKQKKGKEDVSRKKLESLNSGLRRKRTLGFCPKDLKVAAARIL